MTFTVFAYGTDFNVHHNNDLLEDTFDDLSDSIDVAKTRVRSASYDTSWAKVVDNEQAGRMGQSGVVAVYQKDILGRVYPACR